MVISFLKLKNGFYRATTPTILEPMPVQNPALSSGGFTATNARVQAAASTNATSVKASAGQVYSIHLGNNGAGAAYFKLYAKASAPTVGTDTPIATYLIPAGQSVRVAFDAIGKVVATGIAYAITGGAADTDATAVLVNQVVGSIEYA